jgi:V-type H+-transporting ATPase subunit a
MLHKKIRIPQDSANEILFALGKLKNAIEFEDLTKNDLEAKKSFGDMIKRCDEVKKKIDEFIQICNEFLLPINNSSSFNQLNSKLSEDMKERDKKFGQTYFDLIEGEILKNDRKISELVDSHEQVRENLNTLFEKNHVLQKVTELITDNAVYGHFGESQSEEDGIMSSTNTNLVLMAGIIPIEYEMRFKRMIFRVSRGNATTAFYNLEISPEEYYYTANLRQRALSMTNFNKLKILGSESYQNMKNRKKIFSVVFTGSEENILLKKILKVCEIFQASRYAIPQSIKIQSELAALAEDITEKKNILINIERNLVTLLRETNQFKELKGYRYSIYKLYFEQQRLIYTNLGKCILRENFIDGRVWIPKNKLIDVQTTLNNLFKDQENRLNASLTDIENEPNFNPPTLILVNEFTLIPQLIVDTFGIPRYKEINPGYFTIITFPFLFGVMFGDIGHSLFLFCFSIYLLINNKTLSKSTNSMIQTLAQARYFLLLMSIFSFYCGLLYNDFLSVPLYFNSCYHKSEIKEDKEEKLLTKDKECKYKFGLDPVWMISNNELAFINSLKMKFSVIIGVFQMTLGIVLKGINSIYDKNLIECFCVFIPELIFMLILFGYMDLLIFLKWSVNYEREEKRAPDIKSYLMNMILKFGKLPPEPEEGLDWKLYGSRDFYENLHLSLVILAIICLIIMLVPTIILNYNKAKSQYKNNNRRNLIDNEANENLIQNEEINLQENQEPLLSDFIVASVIETIEFALGAVSNTASYLRLWALSLAHSQLSAVFFEYSIGLLSRFTDNPLTDGILLSIVFVIFGAVTFGVLLCMDLMECFLHTLRLHWVEFQNKFFKADGYKFSPFCFEIDIKENNANEVS